ncbi:MAG: tRNA 2-thiouridine(34) synthase MnmA [Proteobacteria bacterium]|nr:tRNA 2-thiouridine(34) synthase MnmA [Pseudomonadota bacterium]
MNLLGFNTSPQDTRIVVAMSGGVDSSVAAALMVEAGFEVIGMTLQLYDQGAALGKKGACCAGQDIYDARQVCDKLDIPHYVLDYESRFNQAVIEDFADSYLKGETPIPCVRCNQQVKFKDLLTTARELGAQALITGHYVQRLETKGKSELHRGVDPSRDQSYFLFATTQNQLDFLRFPLGGLPKTETRAHALRFGLEIADKPDSQDICFVPNGSYVSVLEKLRPGALEEGEIVHLDGRVLGPHKGIINYTVGQRKGLGIGGGDPLYVIRLDPTTHRVIVGPYEALARTEIWVKEVNWLGEKVEGPVRCEVRVRSTRPPVPADVILEEDGRAHVTFLIPEYGVAAGQACVFYQDSRVLGGGWIVNQHSPVATPTHISKMVGVAGFEPATPTMST